MATSVLLAEPGGTTHAETPDGDLCVDGTIAGYLATGAPPARKHHAAWDRTCAPPPVPVPPGASASRVPPGASASAAAAKSSARSARLRPRLVTPGQSTQPVARLGLPAVEVR